MIFVCAQGGRERALQTQTNNYWPLAAREYARMTSFVSPFITRGVAVELSKEPTRYTPIPVSTNWTCGRGWTKISSVLFPVRDSSTLIDWIIGIVSWAIDKHWRPLRFGFKRGKFLGEITSWSFRSYSVSFDVRVLFLPDFCREKVRVKILWTYVAFFYVLRGHAALNGSCKRICLNMMCYISLKK